MQPHLPETVHIVPLGHEYDRAVKVFENSWVNRVYLLSLIESKTHDPKMIQRQVEYTNRVKSILEEKKVKVISDNVNMFDILEVMKHIVGIILKETKPVKNIVYVNMSACGRLTSIGASLAAMAHNAIVYYVVAERYSENPEEIREHGLSICEKGDTIQLQNFQLVLPEEEKEQKILKKLLQKEKAPPYEAASTTDEIEGVFMDAKVKGFVDYREIEENYRKGKEDYRKIKEASPRKPREAAELRNILIQNREEIRKAQINNLMKLRVILDRLEKAHYVRRDEKGGRSTIVERTDSGKYAAYISGLAEGN